MAERNCVTFIWKISNLHGTGKLVESPEFYVNSLRESGWTLRLTIPSSLSEEVTVYLHNNFCAPADALFCIDYEISILAADPQKSVTYTMRNIQINPDTSYQIFNNPTWFYVSQTMRNEFLPQGVLTVQCKLWKLNKSLSSPLYFHAFTSMGTQKMTLKWCVDKFTSVEAGGKRKQRFFMGNSQPTFCVQTYVVKNKKEDMEILIQQTNKAFPKLPLTCQVSVLDVEGIIVRQKESSNVLSFGLEWKFPRFLKKRFLTSRREDYLKNDQLVLLLEITYIANDGFSSIQSISNFSTTSDDFPTSEKPTTDAFTQEDVSHKANEMTPTTQALKWDLYDLYTLNSFSDIVLHGQGRSFPCHKCILSARSPVFLSHFTQSTSEYTTDLDTSTLGTLLQFIYTGDLENKLDFQTALKLYKAAGQYQIISLKQICSDYLEQNMTRENVCDVLLLASKLQDEELKRRAEDFILASPTDILRSCMWKELVKTSADLIVDSMHRIFMVEMDQFNHSYMPILTTPISYDASKSSKKLKSDFLSIFQFPMFTDFRFLINSEYFSVHKNILWARSPVFKAMFSSKMKEIPTNVVRIQDMDAQTLVRMLNFVYSGEIIEDLEYPQLSQLYYAAVKYQICSLKDWCTTSLVRTLSVKNVSDVLMLSDQHGDHKLKKAVLDFVSENDESIILSPEWKKFMTTDSKLASEALYEVYAKKLHGNKSSSQSETKLREASKDELDFFLYDPSFFLEGDFMCLYQEKFQSDFKLCTSKRSFEVHKNILAARSPVFKAMFSSNLKETTTNTLHVPDVDEHTLDQMLRYMYYGGIDTECVDLCKLYYAADKYDINCLKDRCSYTLSKKISVDNVCEILVMADKHGDKSLGKAVQNFLIKKGKEVFNSDSWKDLMLIEPQVACQTMSTIYENKIYLGKLP